MNERGEGCKRHYESKREAVPQIKEAQGRKEPMKTVRDLVRLCGALCTNKHFAPTRSLEHDHVCERIVEIHTGAQNLRAESWEALASFTSIPVTTRAKMKPPTQKPAFLWTSNFPLCRGLSICQGPKLHTKFEMQITPCP